MAMTNEQLTKWIDEIFGTIDEIKQNSGDITGLTRSVKQLRDDVDDLEDQTAGTVTMAKAQLQHFTYGSATQALDLVADITPVQAGTGDPSPTNVRAITGYSSVTATAAGKNLWNGNKTDGYYIDNSGILVSDIASSYSDKIAVNPGDSVIMSGICTTGNAGTKRLHAYDFNGNWLAMIASVKPLEDNSPFSCGGVAPANTAYVVMSWYGVTSHADHDTNIMLEIGSEASTYEAFAGNTATISLGSTVYSGTVNFTTGELVLNKGAIDLGSETWTASVLGDFTRMVSDPITNIKHGSNNSYIANAISDIYVVSSVNALYQESANNHFGVDLNGKIFILDTRYSDPDEFKTAVSGKKLVFELAEPTTTTLTPAQLSLLQGENNVSATSGPITLTYAPDNVLAEVYAYIQKRFDTLTASLAAGRTTRKTTKTLTKKED